MIKQIRGSLKKKLILRTALRLGLTYVIFISFVTGIGLVVRGVTESMLLPLAAMGILVGWFLARENLSAWWEFLGGGTVGFILVVGRVGRLRQPLWQMIREGGDTLWAWARWFETHELPSTGDLRFAWWEFATKTGDILFALWHWVKAFGSGLPNYSYLANRVVWGMVVWILALWFCWAMRRYYRPVWGLLPTGALLSVLFTYAAGTGSLWMLLALGAGLALVGLTAYEEQEHRWKKISVSFSGQLWGNMAKMVLGITLAMMSLSALTPSVSVETFTKPIQKWLWGDEDEEGGIQDMLGVEYNLDEQEPELRRPPGLPRGHLISSPPELSEQVVMVVRFPPGTPPKEEITPLAFYWRSMAYDEYTGSGWASHAAVVERFEPGENMHTYPLEFYETMRQEIRLGNKLQGVLYAPGTPYSIDRDSAVYWRRTWEDQVPYKSLLKDDIFAITLDKTVYQVTSALPTVEEDTLREVSVLPIVEEETLQDEPLSPSMEEAIQETSLSYAPWLEDRYLDLPEDLPKRVYDLAVEVTAGQPTAYDQAKAIETYLRAFPYTLELPAPPLDQDVVDYFLFELQKGYCDYYATSMAVLARATGLPARVVIGYAGGTYDAEEDRYLITEADAHTWPEIYFPEVGWIPFEPTTGKVDLAIEEGDLTVPSALDKPSQTFGTQAGVDWSRFVAWGIAPALSLLLGLGMWAGFGMDRWLLARGTPTQTMGRAYARLHRWSARVGTHVPAAATPYEFQALVEGQLSRLGLDSVSGQGPTPGPGFIPQIIMYYVKDRYRPILLTKDDEKEVVGLWRRLRGRLWLARLVFIHRKVARRMAETRFHLWFRGVWSRL